MDPTVIQINSLRLALGGMSSGVTKLEEVFTGKVEVLFVMNDSNNSFPAGHVENPTGSEVGMAIDFDSRDIGMNDWEKFLNGSFKVVIRGPAAAGFDGKGAEADLQLTFLFDALK